MKNKEKQKIFICEDEALIAADLEAGLKKLGYEVCGTAHSGVKALESIQAAPPDLVLMDIDLKGERDGIEIASLIRDRWGIPVVFTTAYADSEKLDRAKLTFPFGYLLKPIQDRDLKITMEMALYAAQVDAERKKAEEETRVTLEALKKSEEKYRLLADNARDAIWTRDLNMKMTYVSPAVERIRGYTPEEALQQDLEQILTPESAQRAVENFKKLDQDRQNGKEVPEESIIELEHLCKDGSTVWMEVLTSYIRDDQGNPRGILGISRDISERKRMEQELLKQKAILRNILDGIPDVIGQQKPDQTMVNFNQAAFDLLGLRPDEAFGKKCYELIGRSAPCSACPVRDAAASGTPRHMEKYFPELERWFHINAIPILDDQGQVESVIEQLTDITDRKQNEEALRRSEARYRQLFESITDGAFVLDRDWRYVEVNDVAAQMVEKTKSVLLGRKITDLFPGIEATDFFKAYENTMESGRSSSVVNEFSLSDGGRGYYEVNVYPNPIGVLCIAKDISERKEAEEELRRKQEMLARTESMTQIGSWEWDIESDAITWSEEMFRIFQLDPKGPAPGWDEHADLIHPDDRAAGLQLVEKAVNTGAAYELEMRVFRKDGRISYCASQGFAEKNKGGRVIRLFGFLQDITEKKETDRVLSEAAQRINTLFSQTQNPILLVDDQGRYLDANQAALDFLECSLDELKEKKVWDFARPGDLAQQQQDHAPFMSPRHLETEYVVNGKIKTLLLNVVPTEFGGRTLLYGIGQDITARKLIEESLVKSEQKYRALVDNAEEAILVAQDGRFVFANRQAEQMLGRPAGEITSGPLIDFIHPEDRALVENRHFQRLNDRDTPSKYDFRMIRSSGEICWVELKAVVIEWEQEPAVLCFMSDVTERKKSEEEKERLQAQLQQAQKMEAVGALAGGVAHDFNNLLQAITGYTDLLLLDKAQDHPEYHSLSAIRKSGDRASDLVRSLLLFSLKAQTERKPLNLNSELEQARKILERTIPKMVDIETRSGSRLWPVLADPVQIEQILLNLGTNAADAMPDGGRLIIETGNTTLEDDFVRQHLGAQVGRYVQLTISDTGHGMDRATREKIYEPFFTTKEIGQGTGLGLASVYGIVKSHGGYIDCYSEIGQGTTFKIYLPAMDQPPEPEEKPRPAKPPMGRGEIVLLVDDEEAIRGFAEQALEKFGYQVLTASSGEEALEVYQARADRINLVVMDLGMPGMGGHKCLQELLRLDPEAKVIISSGYSVNGQARKSLTAGAVGYVGKPYRLTELLAGVREALDPDSGRSG